MISINFRATGRLLRNWGAYVDTILAHVKEGDIVKERLPIWKKPKHAQDQGRPMESWLMGQKNILGRCWSARFGNRPMEVADKSEGKKKSELYENSDDSVIDF